MVFIESNLDFFFLGKQCDREQMREEDSTHAPNLEQNNVGILSGQMNPVEGEEEEETGEEKEEQEHHLLFMVTMVHHQQRGGHLQLVAYVAYQDIQRELVQIHDMIVIIISIFIIIKVCLFTSKLLFVTVMLDVCIYS